MTIKLYDNDSYLQRFEAEVLSCAPAGDRWRVILDQTAFFPEGGGQAADPGVLGGVRVLDVQEEPEGIAHYVDKALTAGQTVQGEIDWPVRFRRMQNHTGEHIVSGLCHKLYGYENVGFHLGEEAVTIDFSGELTWEQLLELERLANEAVWADVPVKAEYPDPAVLKDLRYRSKLELTENVRIVTVEGYDVCACCAPHVHHTGEIGAIKILDSMRHRGGVRLTMICGTDAQVDYAKRADQVKRISNLLSVPRDDITQAVEKLMQEKEQLERTVAQRDQKLCDMRLKALRETEGNLCIVDEFENPIAMRELVNAGMALCGGVCAAFSGNDKTGYRYIIGSRTVDLRSEAKAINAALKGKGGGQSTMIQGSCTALRAEIEAYFAS